MQKWTLPTLSEILALSESSWTCPVDPKGITLTQNGAGGGDMPLSSPENTLKRVKAQREWRGAIAAVEQLLLESINYNIQSVTHTCPKGLVLAGPAPVLSHSTLLGKLQTRVFTPEWMKLKTKTPFQLPPATAGATLADKSAVTAFTPNASTVIPLLPEDPLAGEQFCLVLTQNFSLLMVLGVNSNGVPEFMFSFEPEVVEQAWRSLRERVTLTSAQVVVSQLDTLFQQNYPVAPDYRIVTQFSRLLLKHLPEVEEYKGDKQEARGKKREAKELPPCTSLPVTRTSQNAHCLDVELLQAFAHEVRTPLTTIRTLIRLVLKRRDLGNDVLKRLESIEHECIEQINRMELLFRAAELETSKVKNTSAYLTPTSLEQVLQQSIPRWQHSAKRRNLTLDVILPQQLPSIVSDPRMLDQVLTGLIENFSRSLPAGSQIQVQVILAGDQLKLQLLSQSQPLENGTPASFCVPPIRKSLGPLLMFQPETGNISLNLKATKDLFQAIGGKLIVRQRPHQGEVLTIFLPLDVSRTSFTSSESKGLLTN